MPSSGPRASRNMSPSSISGHLVTSSARTSPRRAGPRTSTRTGGCSLRSRDLVAGETIDVEVVRGLAPQVAQRPVRQRKLLDAEAGARAPRMAPAWRNREVGARVVRRRAARTRPPPGAGTTASSSHGHQSAGPRSWSTTATSPGSPSRRGTCPSSSRAASARWSSSCERKETASSRPSWTRDGCSGPTTARSAPAGATSESISTRTGIRRLLRTLRPDRRRARTSPRGGTTGGRRGTPSASTGARTEGRVPSCRRCSRPLRTGRTTGRRGGGASGRAGSGSVGRALAGRRRGARRRGSPGCRASPVRGRGGGTRPCGHSAREDGHRVGRGVRGAGGGGVPSWISGGPEFARLVGHERTRMVFPHHRPRPPRARRPRRSPPRGRRVRRPGGVPTAGVRQPLRLPPPGDRPVAGVGVLPAGGRSTRPPVPRGRGADPGRTVVHHDRERARQGDDRGEPGRGPAQVLRMLAPGGEAAGGRASAGGAGAAEDGRHRGAVVGGSRAPRRPTGWTGSDPPRKGDPGARRSGDRRGAPVARGQPDPHHGEPGIRGAPQEGEGRGIAPEAWRDRRAGADGGASSAPRPAGEAAGLGSAAGEARGEEAGRGKCTWPLANGGVCGSEVRLEIDHVVPRGKGGASTVENCRILCKAHNLEAAREAYGDELWSGSPEEPGRARALRLLLRRRRWGHPALPQQASTFRPASARPASSPGAKRATAKRGACAGSCRKLGSTAIQRPAAATSTHSCQTKRDPSQATPTTRRPVEPVVARRAQVGRRDLLAVAALGEVARQPRRRRRGVVGLRGEPAEGEARSASAPGGAGTALPKVAGARAGTAADASATKRVSCARSTTSSGRPPGAARNRTGSPRISPSSQPPSPGGAGLPEPAGLGVLHLEAAPLPFRRRGEQRLGDDRGHRVPRGPAAASRRPRPRAACPPGRWRPARCAGPRRRRRPRGSAAPSRRSRCSAPARSGPTRVATPTGWPPISTR